MEQFAKAVAVGIVVSVLTTLLRRYSKEQALMLSLFTVAAILLVLFSFFGSLKELLQQLEKATGVDRALITPVYKCVLISLVSHFASALCKDAQELAIAESITVMGTVAGIYVCMPLIFSVLTLIEQLLGGGGE